MFEMGRREPRRHRLARSPHFMHVLRAIGGPSLDWKGGQRYIADEEDDRLRNFGSGLTYLGPGLQYMSRVRDGGPDQGAFQRENQWLI